MIDFAYGTRIARPAARLETHMAEFVDEEFQRHAVLQRVADAGCEAAAS